MPPHGVPDPPAPHRLTLWDRAVWFFIEGRTPTMLTDARGRPARPYPRWAHLLHPDPAGLSHDDVRGLSRRLGAERHRLFWPWVMVVVSAGLIGLALTTGPWTLDRLIWKVGLLAFWLAIALALPRMLPPSPAVRVRDAMLEHRRCPSCAYRLDTEPEPDGCTVCSECGAAWRLTHAGPPRPATAGSAP